MCDAREPVFGLFAQPETTAQKSTVNNQCTPTRVRIWYLSFAVRETDSRLQEEEVPGQRLKINGMTSDAAMPLRPCLSSLCPRPPVCCRNMEHGALIRSFLVGDLRGWVSTCVFCLLFCLFCSFQSLPMFCLSQLLQQLSLIRVTLRRPSRWAARAQFITYSSS